MRTPALLLIILLCGHVSVAQITFEKGYFIDTLNQRTECEIKNRDWRNNPSEFEYRIGDSISLMPIGKVIEFAVYDKLKYKVATVQIDKSPVSLTALSRQRNAEFENKTLALKVLIEGPATLYVHESQNVVRFFYSVNENEIRQLVYKMYHSSTGKVLKNNEYQQELLTKMACGNVPQDEIKKVAYKRNDLEIYFARYNACLGKSSTGPDMTQYSRQNFFVKPTVGIGSTNMRYTYSEVYDELVMKNGFTYRVGAELEMILPFNNSKWSLVADLYYQASKNTGQFENPSKGKFTANYSSIDLAFGPRYYHFLGNENRIFVNAMIVVNKPIKLKLDYESDVFIPAYTPDLLVKTNVVIGAGFSHRRFNVELRYALPKEIHSSASIGNTSFTRISIIASRPLN